MARAKRAFTRWMKREQAAAFASWLAAVRGRRAAAGRITQLVVAALRRMQQLQLSRGLRRWVAHCDGARRNEALLQQCKELELLRKKCVPRTAHHVGRGRRSRWGCRWGCWLGCQLG